MCELFGVSSPEKIELNTLLTEFFSHGNHHPDGWGMAFFFGNEVSLEKQPINSTKSMYLKSRLQAASEADNMIAHIRLATKGMVEYENTHPFVIKDISGRTWTLAHNGTIFDSEVLDPMFYSQRGQTDSERILLYIIKQINARLEECGVNPERASNAASDVNAVNTGAASAALTAAERFRIIDQILCEITPGNKVNLLLYDGELLYAHTNYAGSLHLRKEGRSLLFSTKPLGKKDWHPLPMNTLLAYHNGERVFEGTNHGNEFFDSTSKTRHLYLDYAAL